MWLTTSTIMSFTTEPRQIQNSNYGIGTKFRSDKRISKKMIDRYLYMIIIYMSYCSRNFRYLPSSVMILSSQNIACL